MMSRRSYRYKCISHFSLHYLIDSINDPSCCYFRSIESVLIHICITIKMVGRRRSTWFRLLIDSFTFRYYFFKLRDVVVFVDSKHICYFNLRSCLFKDKVAEVDAL